MPGQPVEGVCTVHLPAVTALLLVVQSQAQAEVRSRTFSGLFSQTCLQPYLRACSSEFPGICQSVSKFPVDISFSCFSFKFFVTHLLTPNCIAASGNCSIEQLSLIVFHKVPRERAFCTRPSSDSGQIKADTQNGVFEVSFLADQIMNLCSLPLSGFKLVGFYSYCSWKTWFLRIL